MVLKSIKATPSKKGFNRRKRNLGYKPTPNGEYIFRIPIFGEKMKRISLDTKRTLLFNYGDSKKRKKGLSAGTSDRQVAEAFGVHNTTVMKWRELITKLSKERPTIAVHLLSNRKECETYATEYYKHGGNWLRLKYGLTNIGVRGLITGLSVLGFIKQSKAELEKIAKTNNWKYDETVARTVTTVW